MISYLNGTLEYILYDYIIVDVNNTGYQVFVSSYTISQLPKIGSNIKIHTHMNVREDAILLYGFLIIDELDMFNMLIMVSGIGPKAALAILSTMRPADISTAIIIEDITSLSKAQGIGKKTAQRLILDLKDKLKTNTTFQNDTLLLDSIPNSNSYKQEAIEALIGLGYSQMEATKAVISIYQEDMSTEDIIKSALKKISKF